MRPWSAIKAQEQLDRARGYGHGPWWLGNALVIVGSTIYGVGLFGVIQWFIRH